MKEKQKPVEISLQVVKNLGNFESVRASITYVLNGEDTLTALTRAKNDIDTAFEKLYERRGIPAMTMEKEPLTEDSPIFNRLKKGLKSGEFTIEQIFGWYEVSEEIEKILLTDK